MFKTLLIAVALFTAGVAPAAAGAFPNVYATSVDGK